MSKKLSEGITAKKRIRESLELLVDKEKLVQSLSDEHAHIVNSPLRADLYGFEETALVAQDKTEALALLEREGYQKIDGKIGKVLGVTGSFTTILQQGSSGTAVEKLQECLARDSKVYPEGTVSGTFGPLTKKAVIAFQEKYAADILTPINLSRGTGKVGPSTNEKLNSVCDANSNSGGFTPLVITLTTLNQSPLQEIAQEIRSQWETAGLQVEVRTLSATDLERDVIKPRAYEALLFGEILSKIPDPFPFWHSSQKRDPGLNLSLYASNTLDTLLERARKTLDEKERSEIYERIQETIISDTPAIFLYDIDYVYFAPKEVQGIQTRILADPSERFSGIDAWYLKTKRVF